MNTRLINKVIPLNKVIKILIFSDFFLQSGWGLIGPVFAIFITNQISGGTLETVGFVVSIYWIVKSFLQPSIAKYLDRNHGEIDDFRFLVIGMFVSNLIPLGYIYSTAPWHLYLLELIRGVAMACVVPTWYAIFTRHIDKGKEAFSWSIESTGIGIAAGVAAAAGGWTASVFGFKIMFLLTSIFGIISSALLLAIKKDIFPKDHVFSRFPPPEKTPTVLS